MNIAIKIETAGPPEVMGCHEIQLSAPGPHEALVRHEAINVAFIDLQQRMGRYALPLPSRLGFEAAGTVTAVGPGTTKVKAGDKVVYISREPGAYASARVCPEEMLVRLPPDIDVEQAAVLFSRGIFAWCLTHAIYPVGHDDHVVVHAAAGGVGSAIAHFARTLGAQVIGIVGSESKIPAAMNSGCNHVVLSGDVGLSARVRDLTRGGATVVYDSIGQPTFRASLDSLRKHGMFVAFGNAGGKIAPFSLMEESGARGSLAMIFPMLKDYLNAEYLPRAIPALFAAMRDGRLNLPIGQRFPLGQAVQAHRLIEARQAAGATILIPT